MTDPSPDDVSPSEPASAAQDSPERLVARLSRLEAQVHALQDRLGELDRAQVAKKQRALVVRLVLLAVLLGLFFFVRAYKGQP